MKEPIELLVELFHPESVAERLGITRRTVDRMIKRGDLRLVYISPRKVYVDPDSLREHLGEQIYKKLFPRAGLLEDVLQTATEIEHAELQSEALGAIAAAQAQAGFPEDAQKTFQQALQAAEGFGLKCGGVRC
jgi:DNA-binding transcriptional regulator LsrR (DeoR family)